MNGTGGSSDLEQCLHVSQTFFIVHISSEKGLSPHSNTYLIIHEIKVLLY